MKRDELQVMTIDRAANCRTVLLEYLARGKPAVIDVSKTVSIDLSGIQILIAFFREAEASRHEAHLTGALSPEVRRVIAIAGLGDGECESGECLETIVRSLL